jgi:RNA polymerase-binding protein DksA
MADMGTDAMEREKAFLFASAEGRLLYNVDQALRRLYRNEYGVCQVCGKEIGKPRLDAIPHASLCVSCQEKQEKETNSTR